MAVFYLLPVYHKGVGMWNSSGLFIRNFQVRASFRRPPGFPYILSDDRIRKKFRAKRIFQTGNGMAFRRYRG